MHEDFSVELNPVMCILDFPHVNYFIIDILQVRNDW